MEPKKASITSELQSSAEVRGVKQKWAVMSLTFPLLPEHNRIPVQMQLSHMSQRGPITDERWMMKGHRHFLMEQQRAASSSGGGGGSAAGTIRLLVLLPPPPLLARVTAAAAAAAVSR